MSNSASSPSTLHAWTNGAEIEVSDPDRLVREPLVSVLMITYNHAEYIAEAIEGVVAQQCNFAFELIIGEDASKDETKSIALEYQRCYPEIIRVVYSESNVGMNANGRRVFSRARGKFVALCEGDDYWCWVHKLAKQVELIALDDQVGIVHTDWVRSRRGVDGWQVAWGESVHRRVPLTLLEGDIFGTFHYPKILRTCTVLVRRDVIEDCGRSVLGQKEYKFGDAVLAAYTTSRWKVAYLAEVTAVYRESPNSVLRSGNRARLDFLKSSLEFDTEARHFFVERKDYPQAYRWEVSMGLLLWAIRARDIDAARFALSDIRDHFGLFDFIAAGWKTIVMRRPTLLRQQRSEVSIQGFSENRVSGR